MDSTKNKEKKKVALVSVFAAVGLTIFKFIVGIITGSLGILSEALHSGLDLVAAVITFFAVRYSGKPSDETHHYGHGKIENLSALIETGLLVMTCVWIVYEAIHRILSGVGLVLNDSQTIFAFIVVITSIVVDIWRSRKLYKVAKKYKSQALEADALHFSTDIWSSVVVLLGLVCVKIYEWTQLSIFFYADSVAALLVAGIVIFVCWNLAKKATNSLLDRAPEKETNDIIEIIENFSSVLTYHDLRVRHSGSQLLVEATIHLDSSLTLVEAHKITDKLEKKLFKYEDDMMVNIHAEPDEH